MMTAFQVAELDKYFICAHAARHCMQPHILCKAIVLVQHKVCLYTKPPTILRMALRDICIA